MSKSIVKKKNVAINKAISGNKKKKSKISIPANETGLSDQDLAVVPRLSNCAAEYACALEDPFNCLGTPCVPDFPSLPSRKMLAFSRGTMIIGTAGMGFVTASAWDGAMNNKIAGYVTDATFAGTALASTGTGVVGYQTNSDYITTNIGSTSGLATYRVVGGGIRIKYTGTELNRSGMVFHLEEPYHNSTDGFSIAAIEAFDRCLKTPVSRTWHSVTYHPNYVTETSYTNVSNFQDNKALVLAVTSLAGNSFDYEFFGIYEFVGSNIRGKTPSMTDLAGFSAVLNVVQDKQKIGYVGEVNHNTLKSMVWNALVKTVSGIAGLAWEHRGKIMNLALKAMDLTTD